MSDIWHPRDSLLDNGLGGVMLSAFGIAAGLHEGAGPRWRHSTDEINFVDTPKPLSKRAKRRLRGKSKAHRP